MPNVQLSFCTAVTILEKGGGVLGGREGEGKGEYRSALL